MTYLRLFFFIALINSTYPCITYAKNLNPCDTFLSKSVPNFQELSGTEIFEALITKLLNEKVITHEYLEKLVESLDKNQTIPNPFPTLSTKSEHEAYKPIFAQFIENDEINKVELRQWAAKNLQQWQSIQQKKQVAQEETQVYMISVKKIVFNKVAGGTLLWDDGFGKKIPVEIESFELMQTALTQWMWAKLKLLMGATDPIEIVPSRTTRTQRDAELVDMGTFSYFMKPDHPVYNITWNTAQKFIQDLNLLSNSQDPQIQKALAEIIKDHKAGDIYGFPEYFSWAYVSTKRDQYDRTYFFNLAKSGKMLDYGWFEENSSSTTHPVAEKAPLVFDGLPFYDLRGNVMTWLNYTPDQYIEFLKSHNSPHEALTGRVKYYLGGNSFENSIHDARIIFPDAIEPDALSQTIGLRLVRKQR